MKKAADIIESLNALKAKGSWTFSELADPQGRLDEIDAARFLPNAQPATDQEVEDIDTAYGESSAWAFGEGTAHATMCLGVRRGYTAHTAMKEAGGGAGFSAGWASRKTACARERLVAARRFR